MVDDGMAVIQPMLCSAGTAVQRDEMSIGYSDIWVGSGVNQGWVGTVLPQVLLRWMPSRLSPLVVAAVSAAAAAAAAAADNDDNYDDDDDAFLRLTHL